MLVGNCIKIYYNYLLYNYNYFINIYISNDFYSDLDNWYVLCHNGDHEDGRSQAFIQHK